MDIKDLKALSEKIRDGRSLTADETLYAVSILNDPEAPEGWADLLRKAMNLRASEISGEMYNWLMARIGTEIPVVGLAGALRAFKLLRKSAERGAVPGGALTLEEAEGICEESFAALAARLDEDAKKNGD